MIGTALYSGALKSLDWKAIIELCVRCRINKIEWDSIHIPLNSPETVKEIEQLCRLNALLPVSFNTNITVTDSEDIYSRFKAACECARLLRAPAVNVTIGLNNGDTLSDEKYNKLVQITKELCTIANTLIVNIVPDYNSVISTADDALMFMADVHMINLKLYWTPNILKDVNDNKDVISKVIKYTTNIYISNKDKSLQAHPLIDVKNIWREYAEIICEDNSRLHLFVLNSLPEDNLNLLSQEFMSLRRILAKFR